MSKFFSIAHHAERQSVRVLRSFGFVHSSQFPPVKVESRENFQSSPLPNLGFDAGEMRLISGQDSINLPGAKTVIGVRGRVAIKP